MSETAQEAAGGVVSDLLSELAPYAEDAPEAPPPVPEPEPDPEDEGFVLDPVMPADLAELLAESEPEPDDDDDDDDDGAVATQVDEYEDEDVTRLRKQLAKEVKKREHAEKLRAQDNHKRWSVEAKKYLPLSQPETIKATTHRAFLAEAKRQHDLLKPVFEQALAAKEAEVKKLAAEQWGKPMAGPGQVPIPTTSDGSDALKAARDRGSFKDAVKAMLESGQVRL